ncbi:MAG: hypothetical protein JWQ19_3549 [Subtercola sp.]|nr:hypothetical protein [Subtercola sp.]
MFHDSRKSQFVQMADLVAYTAFLSLNQHRNNEFGWNWYSRYLQEKDVHSGPRSV